MMTLGPDAWLTIAVIVATMAMLVWERFAPEFVLMGAVAVLLLFGVLTPVQALAGFSNTAVLTVAVLFIVAAGLRGTGAIRWVGAWVLGKPRGAFLAQARLIGVSSSLSAFINNTPVVAMLTSAVEDWSRKSGISVSKLLLPLSYATILGGLCSLIGTSTNLIVDGLAQAYPGLPQLRMFDPAWVGVPAALVGMLYLLTVGRWLLPDRRGAMEQARDTKEYVLEMRVDPAGPLDGKTLDEAGLRGVSGLFLAEIQREGRLLPALTAHTRLQGDDRLVIVGSAEALREVRQWPGLAHADDQVFKIGGVEGRHFVEVVLSRLSPMVGRSLREGNFRHRYDAVVVAVNRHGRQLRDKPGNAVLQTGDTLLLETTPGFTDRFAQSHEFAMVNLLDDTPTVQPRKALLSLTILGAMIAANTLLRVDIFVSALAAGLAMLVTGCVQLRDARKAVDFPLIVVIACAFAIGRALQTTGVANEVAHLLLQGASGDPFRTLVLLYVCTVVFTELLTNNAAAVLMFPIGMAAAAQLGVLPMPFVMTVMVGSSAAFITPIGYQTNLMVYGPGGYRFLDYVKVGTPLSILVGAVVLWVIPQVWPFA
ncbi:SLC13 family permease [Oleiagrimonas soli]|uniref:Di/tricarboxylate transporter n=2 Tax=Oleiagrimonas soli TaxID=1543381 RepID=A0A841KI08_9GAMM|nr:SLC13 family permease [Oleiagrimonas soli]MBB6184685.1 di/tricarboxylate transporter [Oleiagrimonas soli]